jgi:hypothetical protein
VRHRERFSSPVSSPPNGSPFMSILPKLRDGVVFQAAIRDTVAKLDPTFGCADGFDEATGRYRNLIWG